MSEINWTTIRPTKPGTYHFHCGEMDHEHEKLLVYMRKPNSHLPHELYVDDPNVGHYPIDTFHENLQDPHWSTEPIEAT